ncbi:hypothetical protein AAJ76_1510001145 [Vairimorpha ceranae]|uniref:Uncharacterized protein n=1 Tax=Vairimorpha ceranae TaxID=40302 RepID=A0A0F9Z7R9_9MICR|nr:hypothetical protein AAJ76_1510001145 [Vairimorpha ceranae]KKO73984.1 hypothetical protein AAJ76_1510001145 [Vairimorpha ceranae]
MPNFFTFLTLSMKKNLPLNIIQSKKSKKMALINYFLILNT